jgi:hypothetical protein
MRGGTVVGWRRVMNGSAVMAGMTPAAMPAAGVVSTSVPSSPMPPLGCEGNASRHGQDRHDQGKIPDLPRQL